MSPSPPEVRWVETADVVINDAAWSDIGATIAVFWSVSSHLTVTIAILFAKAPPSLLEHIDRQSLDFTVNSRNLFSIHFEAL